MAEGIRLNVTQAEQGDPLMPLLFSIAIQGALEEVATMLLPGEQLRAFLDDVYALCSPDRVKPIYEALARALHRVAGIRLHQGKTRVWNKASIQPGRRSQSGRERVAAWRSHGSWHPCWARAVHKRQVARQSGRGAEVVGSNPESA